VEIVAGILEVDRLYNEMAQKLEGDISVLFIMLFLSNLIYCTLSKIRRITGSVFTP